MYVCYLKDLLSVYFRCPARDDWNLQDWKIASDGACRMSTRAHRAVLYDMLVALVHRPLSFVNKCTVNTVDELKKRLVAVWSDF